MAVNDNDMELLHEYVDGELPVADCEGLCRRLAVERDPMGELDHLRVDHAVRTMVWNSLEPEESTVARLESKIMRATRARISCRGGKYSADRGLGGGADSLWIFGRLDGPGSIPGRAGCAASFASYPANGVDRHGRVDRGIEV